VFKPVPLGTGALLDPGPAPGRGFDGESLFWHHERLHREVLLHEAREPVAAAVRTKADALEADALQAAVGPGACDAVWAEHRERVEEWRRELPPTRRIHSQWARYWRGQCQLESIPARVLAPAPIGDR
jgi:hypothetical protein